MRNGGQIGAVRLHDDPVDRHVSDQRAHLLRRLEGGDAGDGEPGAHFRRLPGQLRTAGVAVHQHPERPSRVLLAQDLGHGRIRLARMDHQRQAGLPRGMDVLTEHLRLHLARAEVVVEVEAALADPHHFRPSRKVDQRRGS